MNDKLNSVLDLLNHRVEKYPDKACVGKINGHDILEINYQQLLNKVTAIAKNLKAAGHKKGMRVAIISETRLSWHLADLGSLKAGLEVVPIYPNTSLDLIEYVLTDSNPTSLFIESPALFSKIKSILEHGFIKNIYFFDHLHNQRDTLTDLAQNFHFSSLHQLEKENPDHKNIQLDQIFETDISTIAYTSGTTGRPKGAVITHKAFLQVLKNLHHNYSNVVNEKDISLCFLPLAHVLGRCDSYLHLTFGLQTYFSPRIDRIVDHIQKIKPSIMLAVPKVFEKVHQNILEKKQGLFKSSLFDWAEEVSNQYFDILENDRAPSSWLIVQRQLAYKVVYKRIYDYFGGNIRFFVSGGAPLHPETAKFMRNANLTILEGYGLTETIGPCSVTPIYKQVLNSVGTPIGDVQIKLAEDGEILIKSEALFSHYLNDEEETAKCLKNGYFYTGDIGEITSSGFLKITDRKKDIIITSAGKNIIPQRIENALMLQNHISQAVIIGDKQEFVTALIGIEKKDFINELKGMEQDLTIAHDQLARLPQVVEIIEGEIAKVNKELSDHEKIKKFLIAHRPLSIASGHITPSLKIKKKLLLEEYAEEIAQLYKK